MHRTGILAVRALLCLLLCVGLTFIWPFSLGSLASSSPGAWSYPVSSPVSYLMLGGFSYLLPSSMASIVWALLSVRSAHPSQLLRVPPGDSLVHIWSLKRLSTLPSVGSQTGLSDPTVYSECSDRF